MDLKVSKIKSYFSEEMCTDHTHSRNKFRQRSSLSSKVACGVNLSTVK